MSKLITQIKRLALALCFVTPLVSWAAEITGTDYEPWNGVAGAVAWRATTSLFHTSTVANIADDGTIGSTYTMTADSDTTKTWKRFASNQGDIYTSPGMLLVYDEAGKTASSDAQFAPLSFGGLWVKALQAEGVPYSITDNKTDGTARNVELGAANTSTYFKFDKSFTIDRNSATEVKGTATVEIADGATFTINNRASKGAKVDSGNTLVLKGANTGTLKVVAGLTVGGTLDLSAATRPAIDGDVTLSAGSTIVLPAGTDVSETPFTVCSGTLTSGGVINVKVGSADAEKALVTVGNGAITAIATTVTYTATIDGDTAFSAIEWTVGGEAATITSMDIAVLEISGTGVVTGLTEAPAKVTLASGVTLDVTELSAEAFAGIEKSTAGTYRWTSGFPITVPQGWTYEYVGGSTEAGTVTISEGMLNDQGNLKTSGYLSIDNFWMGWTTASLDILDGKTTIGANSNEKALRGTVTIREDAELVNTRESDALAYDASAVVNVYGTLSMGATRWSLGSNNTLNFHEGCTVTGSGQSSNGTFDWIENATATLNVDGDVTLAAPIRIRSTATVNVNVDTTEQKGLTLAGTLGVGKIVKKGTGLVKFTTNPPYAITVERGAFTFAVDATPTITYSAKPGAGTSMSMWYAKQATWKGTVVIGALAAPAALPLDTYGNADSKIVLTGTTGNCYLNGTTTVAAELVVGTNANNVVEFNNGNSNQVGTFSKVSGPGTLRLKAWTGCQAATYVLNTLNNFEGLAVANNITRNGGGTFTVRIGNIVTTRTTNPGDCVLPIVNTAVDNTTGTVVYDLANAKVNGTTLDLEAKSDGIYVVVPTIDVTVPDVDNTVVTVTVGGESVSPKTEGGNVYAVAPGSVVTVTYTAAEGYRLPDGVQSVYNVTADEDTSVEVSEDLVSELLVAKVRNTASSKDDEYTTLAAAVAATKDGNHSTMVTLKANIDEPEVTVDSAIVLLGNYTINSDIKVVAGGQLQLMQVTLAGKLTIEENGIYVTGGGTLSELVTKDGAKIQLTTLSDTAAPLSVTTLSVAGELTIISSWGSAVRDTYYKALSYVTANADIAEGATVDSVNEWSAKVEEEGDKTVVYLAITKVAVVDGVYYDTAQEAVDAAVASGEPAKFLVQPGTVTLGAGETLIVTGAFLPTVELEDGLTTPPYSLETTPYSEVTGLTIYTVVKEVSVVPASVVISYNTYAELSVIGYDEGATFGWTMYTNGVACSSTSGPVKISSGKTKATVKVYSETTAFDNVVAKVAITTGEDVIEREATITVADVAAKIGETEYTKAQLDNAIADAISSGEVLEHYLGVSTTISKGQTLKTKKLAERNGSASVKAAASTTAGEAWAISKSAEDEDGVITWSVETETPIFEFTSEDGETVEYLAAPKNAVGTNKLLSDATITKQFSVTKDGVVLDLNGHALTSTYSSTTAGAIYVNVISPAPAALTVKDSVGGGSIAAASAHSVFMLGNNGQLTVEGGSFTGKHIVYGSKTTSVATITGGTFTATDAGFTLNMFDSARGTITVTGGTFTGFNPANNAAEGAGTNFVPNGYASTETSTGVWTVAKSGIDPEDPTSTQEVEIETEGKTQEQIEAAAIAAASVTVPDAAKAVVEESTYKNYFTYTVTPTAKEGVYEVAIADLKEEVVFPTEESDELTADLADVLDVAAGADVEIKTAKPGLYYSIEAAENVGFTSGKVEGVRELATTTTVSPAKPAKTGDAVFFRVKVSAAPNNN